MIRSEMGARVAADEPASADGIGAPANDAAMNAAALPPTADRPPVAPARQRPPWLVRHPRKASIALVLAILAASPFVYSYLQRSFGSDPLAGIKSESVRFDASSGMMEVVRSPEVKPVGFKSSGAKPTAGKPGNE